VTTLTTVPSVRNTPRVGLGSKASEGSEGVATADSSGSCVGLDGPLPDADIPLRSDAPEMLKASNADWRRTSGVPESRVMVLADSTSRSTAPRGTTMRCPMWGTIGSTPSSTSLRTLVVEVLSTWAASRTL
jgi:hypothetical protein